MRSRAVKRLFEKICAAKSEKDAARTYILANKENQIIGYYTLVFGLVSIEETTPNISAGLGKYPIPVILLARLAVDKTQKGKGLGKVMMKDAVLRAVQASEIAGPRAFLVPAKDESARSFYKKFGFEPSPHNEFHLFLKISDIRESVADVG